MERASLKFRFAALKAVNLKLRYNFECDVMASDLHGRTSGGRILLQNAGTFLSNYMASRPQNTGKLEYDEGQGKVQLATGRDVPYWEYRYNSTPSLASAIDGVGGHRHAPAALTP